MGIPGRKLTFVKITMFLAGIGANLPLCLGGALDWLFPPLRNPCTQRPPGERPVVSSQTTYTPRFGWGWFSSAPPSSLPLSPTQGIGPWAASPSGTTPISRVLIPMAPSWAPGTVLSGNWGAAICSPSGMIPPGRCISGGCGGASGGILPGGSGSMIWVPSTPSQPGCGWGRVWHPGVQPLFGLGIGGGSTSSGQGPTRAFPPTAGVGTSGSVGHPARLPSPLPSESSLSQPERSSSLEASSFLPLPIASGHPSAPSEPLVPEQPPTLEEKAPILNAPSGPFDSGPSELQSTIPAKPSVGILPQPKAPTPPASGSRWGNPAPGDPQT